MPSLRDLQVAFASALLGDGETGVLLADNAVTDRQALSVYRNNSRAAFLDAMTACYPVLRRLTGEAYFRQMAFAYRRCYPSRVGNLFFVGCRLPEYLDREYAETEYAYFADVARLEWACQEALVAAESPALDRRALAAIQPHRHAELRFLLHPSVRLLRSLYPVFEIWRDNQADAEPAGVLDLGKGGQSLLVRRADEVAEVRQLCPADFEFLSALDAGMRFTDALERTTGTGSDFDAAVSLESWVSRNVIVDFLLDPAER